MAQTIRFHLDENGDPRIAIALRRLGVDVTLSDEVGLLQASDDRHLAFAISQNRVIITKDTDFLKIARSGIAHPGMVFFHDGTRIGEVVRYVRLIWEIMEPSEMTDRVEYV